MLPLAVSGNPLGKLMNAPLIFLVLGFLKLQMLILFFIERELDSPFNLAESLFCGAEKM